MIQGKTALLVVDMQYDFLEKDAPACCIGGMEIVPNVKKLIEACKKAHVPVIYTKEVHRPSRVDMGRELDLDDLPDHCILGTHGVEIHQDLTPSKDDIVVNKVRYNAFLGTELQYVLNGLGVLPHDTLIICGVCTSVCVLFTCAAAFQHDYRFKLIEDCCADLTIEAHQAALTVIDFLIGGSRVTLEDILKDVQTIGK